ncbi:glycosyltransferase [Glycomyces harbinensis]|uniref:Uncharacterized protein n=1 Tax=Glycomyces harbinensis TaxID=58114 RepID=A0A1G6UXA5_9ACTN|nr:glycosyltransferase [Glycomyces harbinensis]SDD45999.1 hypothetical protein SAMN05216270_104102 [Glycomyces harbinensis]
MIDVLFISSSNPPVNLVADTVRLLDAEGARVWYGGTVPSAGKDDELVDVPFADRHRLPRTNLRHAVGLPNGERVWLRNRTDSWLREKARAAHVIVALDNGSIYTVWQLARRNRAARAVFGLSPALASVRELAREGGTPARGSSLPSPSFIAQETLRVARELPASVARALTSRSIMRSSLGAKLWRVPLRAPGVPDRLRVATGRRVAEAMNWAGRRSGAAYALALTATHISDPATKAELLDDSVQQELDRGVVPEHLGDAVQALLAHADESAENGRIDAAAQSLLRALMLGFHRVVHIDQLSSPLAEDAEAYVKPFHRSRAMQTVATTRGRVRPAAPPPTDRPLRLLVMVRANDHFLPQILDRYREHPGVELRYLDLAQHRALRDASSAPLRVLKERLGGDDEYAETVERLLRPHLDWADTVFLDWCLAPSGMLTTIDPGDTRMIIRLHSYEAFTRWTHMADFSRIDDLVFVADHVRDLAEVVVPQLSGPQAPRKPVLHNAMPLNDFARPKTPDARFNLGLVGVGQVAKDPLWAVEVLRLLREEDERYRLWMVGGDMPHKNSRASRNYRNEMEKVLDPLVESGAVLRLGPTDDVAGKLVDLGFILSTSVREGSHNALMEGAASGAVPVVRNWPFYADKANGARTLYPEGWIVETPAAAAERVLQVNASEENWHDNGKLASKYALSTWDWSVVSADFDRLFLGEQK